MDSHSIVIQARDLVQEVPVARDLVRSSHLPNLLATLAPGPYGLTVTHLEILALLEETVGALMEVEKRLHGRIARDRGRAAAEGFAFDLTLSAEDRKFSALFSLFAAAEGAAGRCRALTADAVEVRRGFPAGRIQPLLAWTGPDLGRELIADLHLFLKVHRDHPDPARRITDIHRLTNTVTAYFQLLARGCRTLGEDARYELHRRALERLTLEVMGRRYRGFASTEAGLEENPSGLLPVVPEDIVGNEDYLQAGLRLARDVAGYDFEQCQNPKRLNPVLFALGPPGCGKTVTAHAVGNYFLKYCRERNVPARFQVIRRTDWASSYQNASANQLIRIFKEAYAFPGVVGLYWPDIDTAFAARSDPGIRTEERNILGACFGIFDGTLIPRDGKWFLLCDANSLKMDEATLSRITQDPYRLTGPTTAEDFVALMRDKLLRDVAESLLLTSEEWQCLGERCAELGFSGRSIENICRKVIGEIQDVDPPEEYYRVGFQERRRILRELARPLDGRRLREILETYHRFEREAERQAEEQRFRERVEEIVLNLSARRQALKVFEPAGD